ncbi:MAG: hypothetical protein FJ088_10250, partial [Deltaproteobacteria bacterium]|nr:hypothetical protein [Deltaproteobacteria bacterium]
FNDSRSRAFFSHHFFDWRLTQTGKASFSLQHFEKGLGGALRTLERLLIICRSEFYSRYKDYLKRTPDGLYSER